MQPITSAIVDGAPQVVALDLVSDSLDAFVSERDWPVSPAPEPQPRPLPSPSRVPAMVRVRVRAALGASALAVLSSGLTGIVTVALLEGSEMLGRPRTLGRAVAGATGDAPAAPNRRGPVPVDVLRPVLSHGAGAEGPIQAPAPAVAAPAARPRAQVVEPSPGRIESRAAPAVARPVPMGSVGIISPFPVRVVMEGQEIGTSAAPSVSVPAGEHTLTLVNERLEFEEVRPVTVTPRRTATITVTAPNGTLHLNADPWAQVWIDGRRVGETPLGNLSLPVGEHEVVLRHPELGEERRTVTVGVRSPVHVGVEFTR